MKAYLPIISLLILTLPAAAFAISYTPLTNIPGVNVGGNDPFGDFVNKLYAFSITIAGLLAVIKIIIAGVKWMMTDVVTTKGQAKKDIQSALFGLIIVLSAVVILSVIYPGLTKIDLTFDKVEGTQLDSSAVPVVVLDESKITVRNGFETFPASESSAQRSAFNKRCYGDQKTPLTHILSNSIWCVNNNSLVSKPLIDISPLDCSTNETVCNAGIESITIDCVGKGGDPIDISDTSTDENYKLILCNIQ